MNDEPPQVTPAAERRLAQHLELLRTERPQPGTALVPRVLRTARWQRAARVPLRVIGMIAGSVLDGVIRLVAPGRRKRA